MVCPNCFSNVGSNEKFCSKCGNKMGVNNNLLKPKVPFKKRLKDFFDKYKKAIIIVGTFVLLVGLIVLLYSIIFGFEKISWSTKYDDYNLEYVSPSTVILGVNFSNEKKIDKIKFTATCGKVKVDKLEVSWDLTDALGECKITASYKLRKISKKITVVSNESEKKELTLEYEIDLDSDEDLDYDRLTNKQEKEYGTDPQLADSDMDGLYDNDEIYSYKTDPNKEDTDGDGLNDYDEITLELDPLKTDSKGDGVKDGKRTLTYMYDSDEVKVSITGTGNIASTLALVEKETKISGKKGIIDKLYTFHTDGKIKEAIVVIPYTDEELEELGFNEDDLSIYYYNIEEAKYEKIDTVVDKENNTLTATLTHFSSYVVADSSKINENPETEILFVLDNSWSMYSNEQYKEITGKEYTGGLFDSSDLPAYDAEGVRFTLTSDLISKLSKKSYKIGLSEFRSDYENALPIGSSAKELKETLNNMYGNFITNSAGTNITNALKNGMNEFSNKVDNKYIVLLTDGQDSSLKGNTESIIDDALEDGIKICSVGFGEASDNIPLANISNSTGCKFYSSTDVSGLSELFDNINVELNNDLVDIDGDNKSDGILLADSGFIANRDGFSFSNYGTNLSTGGHCYGMATFAQLYYKKVLPLKVGSITAGEDTSYAYDLNGTYFEDYANLYDYKLETNALKYTFGYEYFGEEPPKDFVRKVTAGILGYPAKYGSLILQTDLYVMLEEESGLSKEKQRAKYGATYKTYIEPYLDESKLQSGNLVTKDEKNMLNAIYASFIKQNPDTHFASGTTPLFWWSDFFGVEAVDNTKASGFINVLKTRLNDNDPAVISTMSHAVNAINLIQDIDNPNYYYIGVYDNNYPGEKRYIDLKCKKETCKIVSNEYYSNYEGQVLRITPSLEYDLAYYK